MLMDEGGQAPGNATSPGAEWSVINHFQVVLGTEEVLPG